MQRSKCKRERSSSWVTNYCTPSSTILLCRLADVARHKLWKWTKISFANTRFVAIYALFEMLSLSIALVASNKRQVSVRKSLLSRVGQNTISFRPDLDVGQFLFVQPRTKHSLLLSNVEQKTVSYSPTLDERQLPFFKLLLSQELKEI